MNDLRPEIGVEGTLLKKYFSKKAQGMRISKNHTVTIASPSSYNCRETLGHRVKDEIRDATLNPKTGNHSYKFQPLIATKLKSGMIYGRSKIILKTSSVNVTKYFRDNTNARTDVFKVMNYVLGIMGVCLSNPKEEKLRRTHMGAPNEYRSRNNGDSIIFTYEVLSPFWLVSPVMQSIITGIARNCLGVVYSGYQSHLFDKISEAEINSIIQNANRSKALRVFKDIILPFFKKYGSGDDIFLYSEPHRKLITKLVEDGADRVFKKSNTVKYWTEYHDHYGLESFEEDVCSGRNINWNRYGCL